MKFSGKTAERLKFYVYALVDPRDNSIFYVGKANANNRAFDHLKAYESEGEKFNKIKELRELGIEPRVDILRHGLCDEKECFKVEAAIIDSIGIENLTNLIRGHGTEYGRQSAQEIERMYGAEPIDVNDISGSYMMFFINKTYSPTKSEQEIYDATRQYWYNVSKETRVPNENGKLRYATALAIVDSAVVRVYSIEAWFPGGSTFSSRTDMDEPLNISSDRWEFVGQIIPDHELLGRRLQKEGKDIVANQQGYGYIR